MPRTYIPALKYELLTPFYDFVVSTLLPERKIKNLLIDQANFAPESRVLDFGCGTLTLVLMAKDRFPKAEFFAADVDKKILSIAKKKMNEANKSVTILHLEGQTLPFEDNYFDSVISSLVFHHLTKEQKINSFKEIYRVLKPSGKLHILDWGKAKNFFMRVAFLAVQIVDGFNTTTDIWKGLLPDYMKQVGFVEVAETKTFSTVLGNLSLYMSVK